MYELAHHPAPEAPMYPDGIQYDPRNEIVCPKCGRKGRVHRQADTRIDIEHTCPGPWTLAGVQSQPCAPWGAWRAIFRSLSPEEARMYGW